MHLNRDIYWNEKIIVEKLFELFEDDKITHRTFMTVYNGYKEFSENLNDILDD